MSDSVTPKRNPRVAAPLSLNWRNIAGSLIQQNKKPQTELGARLDLPIR
jgi:hypothetical protein